MFVQEFTKYYMMTHCKGQ